MSEAQEALARARRREEARAAAGRERGPIDYEKANKLFRKHKAALTRARNSGERGSEERRDKVVLACTRAVQEWDREQIPWPDNWSLWQNALDDEFPVFHAPRLEDLA